MHRKEVPGRHELGRMDSAAIRIAFLLERIFEPGAAHMYSTNLDRLVVGGFMPRPLLMLPSSDQIGTTSFLERREAGIINIGDRGMVRVGGRQWELDFLSCLYIGLAARGNSAW